MTLMEIIQACQARICGGTEYQWACYGPNARYLDFADRDGTACVSIIFDSQTQTVYSLEMDVPGYEQAFAWRNPDYVKAYLKECKSRKIEPNHAWDDLNYQLVESDVALQYAKDIIATYYDDLPVPTELVPS
jgi:hypothetical protein